MVSKKEEIIIELKKLLKDRDITIEYLRKRLSKFEYMQDDKIDSFLKDYTYAIFVRKDYKTLLYNEGKWENNFEELNFEHASGDKPSLSIVK